MLRSGERSGSFHLQAVGGAGGVDHHPEPAGGLDDPVHLIALGLGMAGVGRGIEASQRSRRKVVIGALPQVLA